jgi:hypothetical protein
MKNAFFDKILKKFGLLTSAFFMSTSEKSNILDLETS